MKIFIKANNYKTNENTTNKSMDDSDRRRLESLIGERLQGVRPLGSPRGEKRKHNDNDNNKDTQGKLGGREPESQRTTPLAA